MSLEGEFKKQYPIKMGDKNTRHFLIGTMVNPQNYNESHAYHGRWCVQTINMWAATLGHKLSPENAIPHHMTIVLHELTHIMAEKPYDHSTWDTFLFNILRDF